MLRYIIAGDNYDAILVSTIPLALKCAVTQYYVSNGEVVKTSQSVYRFDGDHQLTKVETDDTDTLILPVLPPYTVLHDFLQGHSMRRVVIPRMCAVHLGDRALHDIPGLTHYISLSKETTYGSDVFPETVTNRRF